MSNRRLWPRGLPCPDLKAIRFKPDGGELGTDMESGGRRTRRLYDDLPTVYSATMTCSRVESSVFMGFYNKVAGTEFEIEVHSPFRIGQPLTRHRAQFLSLPDVEEFTTSEWKISVEIWLASVDVENYDALAFFATYGDEAGRIALLFDQFCNVTLPAHAGAD